MNLAIAEKGLMVLDLSSGEKPDTRHVKRVIMPFTRLYP